MARIPRQEPTAGGGIRRRFRLPVPAISASRVMVAVVAAIAGAEAPDPFLRAAGIGVMLLIAYRAGSDDGRRDLSMDILRGRDNRPARRAAPEVSGDEGGEPA